MNAQKPDLSGSTHIALWIWLFATAYFTLNALSLGLVSSTADIDQAQQLILSQDLSLGYGAQPPLYSWLVHLLFAITGPDRTVLLAIKVGLLSALVMGFLKLGRELEFGSRQQILAVMGLALIPQILWEAQRDLTHTVLATVLSTWTLWAVIRLRRNASWVSYVLLGLFVGLGLLSKYNYVFFILGLLVAAFSTDGFRQTLRSPRVFVSFAIVAFIALPHFIWVLSHASQVLASSHKFKIQTSASFGGVFALASSCLAFLGVLLLTYGLSWRRGDGTQSVTGPDRDFLTRLLVAILLILLVFIVASGTSNIKNRWLQPLLFFVPLLLVMRGISRQRVFIGIGLAMMLITALFLPGRTLFASSTGKTARPNLPYFQIGESLREKAGVPDVILSPNELLAGNLRLVFPDTRIEVVQSNSELRGKLDFYTKQKILFITDNGGKGSEAGLWDQYLEALQNKAPSVLGLPLLHVPAMEHRVYWISINGDERET